jgi:arylsulfatase
LFDLNRDFSESTDLSAENPDLLERLEQLWIDQATANNVFPLFDPAANYPAHPHEYPLPREASYAPSNHPIAAGRVPSMFGGFVMSGSITCSGTESGVLSGLGDHQGGWVLHLVDGEPRFDVVYGHQRAHLAAGRALDAGDHTVEVTMSAGDLALIVDCSWSPVSPPQPEACGWADTKAYRWWTRIRHRRSSPASFTASA